MTTKQPAAVASGLYTDYYHHEDKPMEQGVCVSVCVNTASQWAVCVWVCWGDCVCGCVWATGLHAFFFEYVCVLKPFSNLLQLKEIFSWQTKAAIFLILTHNRNTPKTDLPPLRLSGNHTQFCSMLWMKSFLAILRCLIILPVRLYEDWVVSTLLEQSIYE